MYDIFGGIIGKKSKKMKIVYCTDTICYPGGIQVVTIAKANALAEIDNNEIWIVVSDNKREPIAKISEKVHLIDLNINYYDDDWKGFLFQLRGMIVKRREHRSRLQKILNAICPDVVISTGTSEKFFLPYISIDSEPSFVREIHFEKKYRQRAAQTFFSKIYAYLGDLYDYGWKIRKYDKVVVLTQEDKESNWKGWNNVEVIPNPITEKHYYRSTNNNKVVIAAGRLVPQKNFDSLVKIWSKIVQKYPDWSLQIWGDGEQRHLLEELVVSLGLEEKVFIMGYSKELLEKMSQASIFVLTSNYEGFGLVILEAMSVGLPVVSYACPAGPKDMIEDRKNGFLIDPNDEVSFVDKLQSLISSDSKRKEMGTAAFEKSSNYSSEVIMQKWIKLFNSIDS